MATKIISVRPDGRKRKYKVKKTTDQRIRELRKALGLNNKWEDLRFQVAGLQ